MTLKPSACRAAAALLLLTLGAAGCGHSEGGKKGDSRADEAKAEPANRVIHPRKGDLRITVSQPGTVQSFESTPIYARISGYVEKYNVDIGARVKAGDPLIDMSIPDLDQALKQKEAATHRADVQIRVAESLYTASQATLETAQARQVSADAGVKRSQAGYTRWESEYKRLGQLVADRVLNTQVRDETYRQFEEAAAARDQANALVAEAKAMIAKATADRDRAKVDIEAARADLLVAQAEEGQARVSVAFGHLKAPYPGVITQRNVSPGDYLQAAGGPNTRPMFILEQTDPVRVFIGVPEVASGFIKVGDPAVIRIQAAAGAARMGKIVRTAFSLNPASRTLPTEIDIPNTEGLLRAGMYVTATITIDRKDVFTLPSNAIVFEGGQSYVAYFEGPDGKPIKTPLLIGPSDDSRTEVTRKQVRGDWAELDGTEKVLVGNIDALGAGQPAAK